MPFGIYTAKSQWDQNDGILITGSQRFEMKAVQRELDFNLQRPADLYRTVHVTGDAFFMKFYKIGSNPRQSFPYEFSVAWAVSQDANVIEDMADSLSSAVQTVSLGFISNLFGGEVNGANSRSGELAPDAQPPAHGSIRIGPDDGTKRPAELRHRE